MDIIGALRGNVDLSTDLRPDQYNVLSATRVRRRYGFDVLYATAAPETLQPLIDFFTQVRGQPGLRKGMVKVTL